MNNNSTNPYLELLTRPEWKAKRIIILARDNNRCCNCTATAHLQVHHRQYHIKSQTGDYAKPWEYRNKYLITLCEECHRQGHKLYKVPVYVKTLKQKQQTTRP